MVSTGLVLISHGDKHTQPWDWTKFQENETPCGDLHNRFRRSYCSTPTIEGPAIRPRSPEAATVWLRQWAEAGHKRFYVVGDTFNLPPSQAKSLCRRIIEARLAIRWGRIVYPQNVDAELAELMVRAGCEQISHGFESGGSPIPRIMAKRFSPEGKGR